VLLLLIAGLTAAAPMASAQAQPPDAAYERRLKLDVPLIAVTGGAGIVSLFFDDEVDKVCRCVKAEVNRLDRSTAGRQSDSIDKASYYVVGFAMGLPAAVTYADWKRGGEAAWADSIIVADAVMTNFALNQWVKIAVNRPRPLLYAQPPDEEAFKEPDNFLSFYSQHTSMTFATGLSYARTFALRHPESRYRWLVYTVALANGATVAAMRVRAGRHFPTDVITGAAIGSAIGLVIPWLHPKQGSARFSFLPTPSGAMFSVRIPVNQSKTGARRFTQH
jgi:membrane-associated phospholipid phosphatase